MDGVLGHMLLGLFLFVPIGFLAGYYQDRKRKNKEKINSDSQKI